MMLFFYAQIKIALIKNFKQRTPWFFMVFFAYDTTYDAYVFFQFAPQNYLSQKIFKNYL